MTNLIIVNNIVNINVNFLYIIEFGFSQKMSSGSGLLSWLMRSESSKKSSFFTCSSSRRSSKKILRNQHLPKYTFFSKVNVKWRNGD